MSSATWEVYLVRKKTSPNENQQARRRVEYVRADGERGAEAAALEKNNNHLFFSVESVRKAR